MNNLFCISIPTVHLKNISEYSLLYSFSCYCCYRFPPHTHPPKRVPTFVFVMATITYMDRFAIVLANPNTGLNVRDSFHRSLFFFKNKSDWLFPDKGANKTWMCFAIQGLLNDRSCNPLMANMHISKCSSFHIILIWLLILVMISMNYFFKKSLICILNEMYKPSRVQVKPHT